MVSNVVGSATSSAATLTVIVPPLITNQPQSLTVNQGQGAAFSAAPAGSTPLSFQWQFNGLLIPGATATNYTIASAQATNAGSYSDRKSVV